MPHSKLIEEEIDKKIYNNLQYNYYKLDDSSKYCFLYFAAFLKDYQISTDCLCSIWHVKQIFDAKNAEETRNIGTLGGPF